MQSWARKWKMRDKALAAALANPGSPIPFTGRKPYPFGRKLRPHHGLQPYLRPRSGGGTSKRNEVW